MARRKHPDNETPEEVVERKIKERVADFSPRPDKVAWERKYNNMQALLEKLRPFEEQMQALILAKQVIVDEIAELRAVMVRECIHPYDSLAVEEESLVKCHFCNKRIRLTE